MSPQVQKLLDEARQLSAADRTALANELFESIADEDIDEDVGIDLEFESEWTAEIQRRVEELKSGAVATIPWSEVRRKMLEQAEGADGN
jgi:putative addiction module component (TIGR02574 family)